MQSPPPHPAMSPPRVTFKPGLSIPTEMSQYPRIERHTNPSNSVTSVSGTHQMLGKLQPHTPATTTPGHPCPSQWPSATLKDIEPFLEPPSSIPTVTHAMSSPYLKGYLLSQEASAPTPTWPPESSQLLAAIRTARAWSPPPPSRPLFKFRLTPIAAKYNMEILESFNFDLGQAIHQDPNSILKPGSEFRPCHLLEPIFRCHPRWPRIKSILTFGGHYPVDHLSTSEQLQDLQDAIAYGNHKSARVTKTWMMSALTKEVQKAWQLPLPVPDLYKIPWAAVAPMGNATQTTIDEEGNRIPKHRLTHDQSFPFSSGTSVNSRVRDQDLPPTQYGFAFSRFLHMIAAMRLKHPTVPIYLSKYDFKSAYRRVHNDPETIAQGIVTVGDLCDQALALASLRLTFGGKPCPTIFSDISEATCDLANAITRLHPWDPSEDIPPHLDLLTLPSQTLPTTPLAPALPLIVQPTVDDHSYHECFIDDIFQSCLALSPSHIKRANQSALLAIDAISRPLHSQEPVPRDPMVAIAKAIAEGSLTECLTILGWLLDTHRMLIKLPPDKASQWTQQVKDILSHKSKLISRSTLETLVGRLQHIAQVLHPSKHFLGRLRGALTKADQHGCTRLNRHHLDDLKLWLEFLAHSKAGVNINLITLRCPTRLKRTDACEYGLGGYDLATGRTWQWIIPNHLRGLRSINFLEFLASVIAILLDILENPPSPGDMFLSGVDNRTATKWMRNSNFDDDANPDHEAHLHLSRFFASTLLKHQIGSTSHWVAGPHNGISDGCSRIAGPSPFGLTLILKSNFPLQAPPNLLVSPLPPAITWALSSWVQHGKPPKGSPPPMLTSKTPTGPVGSTFLHELTCPMTPTWKPSSPSSATRSFVPFSSQSGMAPTPNPPKEMINWLQEHAAPPSMLWQRPLLPQDTPTPSLTAMAS